MNNWPKALRSLHWLIFALVVLAWASVELHELFERGSAARGFFMQLHFHAGLTVFVLMLVRLLVRLAGDTPQATDLLMARLARVFQWLFYPLLLAMPVVGLLTAGFDNKSIGVLELLSLNGFIVPDESRAEQFEELHGDILFTFLLVMLALHAGAALIHHFVRGDDTLRRMLGKASGKGVQRGE